jgi:hypothetical protein
MKALLISLIAVLALAFVSPVNAGGKKPASVSVMMAKAKKAGDAIIGWGEYKRSFAGQTEYFVVAHGGHKDLNGSDPTEQGPFVKLYMSSGLDDYTLDRFSYRPMVSAYGSSYTDFPNGKIAMGFLVDQPPCNALARDLTNALSEVLVDVSLVDSMRVKK